MVSFHIPYFYHNQDTFISSPSLRFKSGEALYIVGAGFKIGALHPQREQAYKVSNDPLALLRSVEDWSGTSRILSLLLLDA